MTNPTTAFQGRRSITTYVQSIEAPPEAVFPLLCPVREAEWLDGWVGRAVHSASGVAEEDGVYASEHAGEADPTIWLVTRRDPEAREIELVAFVPARQVVRLAIRVDAAGHGRSSVDIRYVRTGITEAGNQDVEAAAGRSEAAMRTWEQAMNHYLTTGRKLKRAAG